MSRGLERKEKKNTLKPRDEMQSRSEKGKGNDAQHPTGCLGIKVTFIRSREIGRCVRSLGSTALKEDHLICQSRKKQHFANIYYIHLLQLRQNTQILSR